MTDMLEKMAKAAWAYCVSLDEQVTFWEEWGGGNMETHPDRWPRTGLSRDADDFRAAARAAIQAIRDPDEAMVIAMARAASTDDGSGTEPTTHYDDCDNVWRTSWREEVKRSHAAMINSILQGGGEP